MSCPFFLPCLPQLAFGSLSSSRPLGVFLLLFICQYVKILKTRKGLIVYKKVIGTVCAALICAALFSACSTSVPNATDTLDTTDITDIPTEPVTEHVTEPITEPVTEPVTEPIVTAKHNDLAFAHQNGNEQLKISAEGRLKKGTLTAQMKIPTTGEAGLVFSLTAPDAESYFEKEKGLSYYYFAVTGEKTASLYRVENGKKTELRMQKLVTSSLAAGKNVNISVIFDGNDIYCYLGNRCFIKYTDPNPLTGELFGRRQDGAATFTILNSSTDTTPKKADILIWGHSHTALWTTAENALKENGKVVNIGIGATNTPFWYRLIDEILTYEPKTLIVMSGSNDYGGGTNNALTVKLLDEIYKELRKEIPELKVIQLTEFLQPNRIQLADAVRDFNARLLMYEEENSDWYTVVDVYDIANKAKDTIDTNRFRDGGHLKAEYYNTIDKRVNEALKGKYVFPDREETLKGYKEDENSEKYLYTVGTSENWKIDTNAEGNTRFTSLVKNSMLMFKDITFSGGIIEFDMTVNATKDEHNFKSANGVIFGADSLCVTHNFSHHYVFGRCAWGTMTGYSKDDPDFKWEDTVKGMKGISVGTKQHYKLEWDSKKGTVTYYVNGRITGRTPLERKFNGSYCGIFCDAANTVIENLTFTEK